MQNEYQNNYCGASKLATRDHRDQPIECLPNGHNYTPCYELWSMTPRRWNKTFQDEVKLEEDWDEVKTKEEKVKKKEKKKNTKTAAIQLHYWF